jgi:uncharacterized FlaG/YvyC family protein
MIATDTRETDEIEKQVAERSKEKKTSGLEDIGRFSSKRKKKIAHYVGKIKEIVSKTNLEVSFLNMKNTNEYVFPIVFDEVLVELSDIVMPLPKPVSV